MSDLLEVEGYIRLYSFLAIFFTMAVWELKAPYRIMRYSRRQRWPHQLGLIILNSLILRFLFPVAAAGTAYYFQQQELGLFNVVGWPAEISFIIGFLFLDFSIYWQHVLAHRLQWFWKLHRTHHADTDYDLTTGLRFHPFEMMLSMLIKMAIIALLGIPVQAVLLFEIVLSGSALFNHSNICLPNFLENKIRSIIVTPSMHRIHHSTHQFEHDTNFGFFLSIWDRLFESYTQQSSEDDRTMPIGLKRFREKEYHRLDKILAIPLKK